ncbi:Crp/Fnr family transcriptional regulator [Flavobacterium saccharophilum]|uniref:cAMP-binding domain of CRP or a regulatory subunit of cAMP-dependent protein kinases n=1 Tax=Flavobacterium saccharophilum TaxID=29534 RepID=A0A1M7GKJ5_9FLAO|nr:Crp/Fnr family transcriptional regulator [Flavobacterium saccharophilum]SHM16696.1 cAMP-binding domain of CRP or a regulatory subunit of cAMP-dependent protein kinases [Flavobacterium saccharophilum]
MHDQLLNLITKKIVLANYDKELCEKYFETVSFSKNTIIEHEGIIPKYLYFVVSGVMRLFHYNNLGDEITTHINCPPGFITSYSHFIDRTKSNENVECITDCLLLRITKTDLDFLIQNSAAFRDFSTWVFQQSLAYNENRAKDLANLTAEQRYKKLIENYPEILFNVPLQHIASFLGMNPKSLSRIRKQMIK